MEALLHIMNERMAVVQPHVAYIMQYLINETKEYLMNETMAASTDDLPQAEDLWNIMRIEFLFKSFVLGKIFSLG